MKHCHLCLRPLKGGWRWANGRRYCLNQHFCYWATRKLKP